MGEESQKAVYEKSAINAASWIEHCLRTHAKVFSEPNSRVYNGPKPILNMRGEYTHGRHPSYNVFGGSMRPQISLHSFVLGFVVGCIVIYALHSTVCGRDGCMFGYEEERVLVQVEANFPLPRGVSLVNIMEEERASVMSRDKAQKSEHALRRRIAKGKPSVTGVKEAVTESLKVSTDLGLLEENGKNNEAMDEQISHTSPIKREEKSCPSRNLHLVILILSSPGGVIRRNAIRGTWLHNYHSGMLKVTSRFLIGTNTLLKEKIGNLTVEQNQFGDLLLLPDLKDSYSNLSRKVLRGLEWAYKTETFDFLVKTDDDSYVRIDQVAKNLQQMNCNERLYWGFFMGHAHPEPTGKWAEHNWFNCPHYLPYAMGGGYVISSRVVSMMMRFSHRLKLYNNEDVTVGSWLAPLNLVRQHDIRFDVESLSHGCNNHYIITHKERIRSLYEKYTSLLKSGKICEVEKEIRPSYIYNWTAPPLECCVRTKGLHVT